MHKNTKYKHQVRIHLVLQHSLPITRYKILQLQKPMLTVLYHLLSIQVLHQARQNPANRRKKVRQQTVIITLSLPVTVGVAKSVFPMNCR